jgi:hypothetical protein
MSTPDILMVSRDVVAVLVQLEWQDGHPVLVFGRVIPYVTLCLSTTARSMHHASGRCYSQNAIKQRNLTYPIRPK